MCEIFSLYFLSHWERVREERMGRGVMGESISRLIFPVFSSLLLLLIGGLFFHIFSAWNTTIWEAVWLSLLLLETRCEKICFVFCFVCVLVLYSVYKKKIFFFFFCVCFYIILILFSKWRGKIWVTRFLEESVIPIRFVPVIVLFFSCLYVMHLKKFTFFSIESLCRAFSIII
jgi:hypothetical protein